MNRLQQTVQNIHTMLYVSMLYQVYYLYLIELYKEYDAE